MNSINKKKGIECNSMSKTNRNLRGTQNMYKVSPIKRLLNEGIKVIDALLDSGFKPSNRIKHKSNKRSRNLTYQPDSVIRSAYNEIYNPDIKLEDDIKLISKVLGYTHEGIKICNTEIKDKSFCSKGLLLVHKENEDSLSISGSVIGIYINKEYLYSVEIIEGSLVPFDTLPNILEVLNKDSSFRIRGKNVKEVPYVVNIDFKYGGKETPIPYWEEDI